jgi:hypothetical protein
MIGNLRFPGNFEINEMFRINGSLKIEGKPTRAKEVIEHECGIVIGVCCDIWSRTRGSVIVALHAGELRGKVEVDRSWEKGDQLICSSVLQNLVGNGRSEPPIFF